VSEVKKTNLRAELLAAEAEARAKKRKAAGLPVEDESSAVPVALIEDEETKKRRKVLQEALEMDKDADSDEDDDADADGSKGGEAKYVAYSVFLPLQLHLLFLDIYYHHRTAETIPRAVKMVTVVATSIWMRMGTRTMMMMMTKRTRRQSCSGSWRR
jgi:Cwf15/Cwc15 cell cycle control protein